MESPEEQGSHIRAPLASFEWGVFRLFWRRASSALLRQADGGFYFHSENIMHEQIANDQRHLQTIASLPKTIEVLNYKLGSMNEPTVYLRSADFRWLFSGSHATRSDGWLSKKVDGLRYLASDHVSRTLPKPPPAEVIDLPPVAEGDCKVAS